MSKQIIHLQILHFIAVTFFATCCYGQSREDKAALKRIDNFILDNYKKYAPGCAVLVAKKGDVVFEKAYGTANMELNVSMKPDMVFRIGSITKEFTAVAILQLVEKGQIALSDSIQKFLKGFHNKGKTITIENLLTHTSGIRGYEQLDAKIPNVIRVDFPPKIIVDSLDNLSLEFEPGTRYNYSNSNYYLLGYIIEQVTGKTYQQYLKENIFTPAGLSCTFYDSPTEIIPNRASGYSFSDNKYWNADFISMSLVYSAGALVSNVNDLFKWHQALKNGTLLKKETFQKAITPYQLSNGNRSEYGFGFFIRNENGIQSIGHGGAIDGFRSISIYYPEQDIFIALLCNSAQDNFMDLFDNIRNPLLGNAFQSSYKDLKISDAILDSYIGSYKFMEDTTQSIKIYKKDGRLYGELSNGSGNNMALLAQSETLFYLPDVRRIPTTIEFIKKYGQVTGLYWTQEKKNEAKLATAAKTENEIKEVRLSGDVLNRYVGTYKNEKYNVSIKIYRANSRIYGDLSNGTGSNLMFMALTDTKFFLPDITRIKTMGEFIIENSKAVKLILTQEEAVEFIKIE
jgi:CubicO group peptidase (beta-lactamase class C family)